MKWEELVDVKIVDDSQYIVRNKDIVLVVRCKDCKYGVDYYHEGDCYCSNPKWGLRYFGGSWDFYCADAKRREDADN